jgi:hypothetical protein
MAQKNILNLFEENELNISRLYKLYAKSNPKHKNFWQKLASEEIQHALEIRGSYQGQEEVFEENNFSRGTIKYVSDFVRDNIIKAQKEKVDHSKALEIALRIEQSFLEKKCFELFTPNKQKVKEVLEKLNKETEEHVGRLKKELERIKK